MLILSLAAALQAAPITTEKEDLRCMVAISALIGAAPVDKRPGLTAGLMYFLGRLEARNPKVDLEKGIADIFPKDPSKFGEEYKPDFDRCGAILKERGLRLQQLGQTLQTRAAERNK